MPDDRVFGVVAGVFGRDVECAGVAGDVGCGLDVFVEDGEGLTVADYLGVLGAVKGETFEPKIVFAAVAADVANVLEFRGEGIVDDKASECIWMLG